MNVTTMTTDQREIAPDGRFDEEDLSIDLYRSLALGELGAEARRRQHTAEADAARANALDQRALRHEVHLDLARDHLRLRLRVQTDMGHDGAGHRPSRDQLADPDARAGRVVGDHRQVAATRSDERIDQAVGRSDTHEAADEQHAAVGDQRGCRSGGSCMLHDEVDLRVAKCSRADAYLPRATS